MKKYCISYKDHLAQQRRSINSHVKTSFTEATPRLAPLNASQVVNKNKDMSHSEAAALQTAINRDNKYQHQLNYL